MNDRQQKLLYIFEDGPYSKASGLEGLDAALIGASFEQQVSLLFLFDGVFQLKSGQNAEGTLIKPYTNTFKALEDFEINDVFVHDLSLRARGLTTQDLMVNVKMLDAAEVSGLIAEQDKVFTF